jgi:acyl carrier protein
MNEKQIQEIIIRILGKFAPEADFNEVSPEEDIRKKLDIDSFDFLNIIIALDEELGVEIPESDYGQLVTVSDMVRYLSTRVGS